VNISENGIKLIEGFEGFRANPYEDVAGWKTVGYGHKILSGDSFTYPMSKEDAEILMKKDVQFAVNCLNKNVQTPLNQNQFDALCSFVYNLGQGNFLTSSLHSKLQEGDVAGASLEFPKWCRAGGIVSQGILKRRLAEQTLFNTPV
jgi:lysozyme